MSNVRLIRSQNVGPRTFRALLNHFGGARAALEALPTLARRGGASAPQICSREQAEREIEACGKFGVALVARGEAHYPRRLQMIDDAPPLIAIRGNAAVLTMPPVGIVGSRNASAAGVKITERLTRGLCDAGICHCIGPCARHRCRRTPRQHCNWDRRSSRRRPGSRLSTRTREPP